MGVERVVQCSRTSKMMLGQQSSAPAWWHGWWRLYSSEAVVAWVLAVAISTCLIYNNYDRSAMVKRTEVLVSMCDERARMLQHQFGVSVNHVHALAVLISTFYYSKNPPAINQETFADYTAKTMFERPLLSGVAYAERVLQSERERFELKQGWGIKNMEREPSPVQDEYAPVIFSQQTVSYLESLDMMSGEEDGENILRARASGKAVVTSPFRLLNSNHLGVVLTFPVYSHTLPSDAVVEERIKATAGYLGGAFDVESLVENLLNQLAGNEAIFVNVHDVTNQSFPLIMYGPPHYEGDTSLSHVSLLDFGDPYREHQMSCRYKHRRPIAWLAVSSAVGWSTIWLLIGYIGYSAASRIVHVEESYQFMEKLKIKAEAADIAKSQFLATVSHEIRTPMNGVLGMLTMLLDTPLDSTQKEFAQTAQECGKTLINLINDVLDRAKIEARKFELECVPFDIRSILDDVVSMFSGKSGEKNIELAVFVSDKVPEIVRGDPRRFKQIVTNLVNNSIKFTEQGHIFVQVHIAENWKRLTDGKTEDCLSKVKMDRFDFKSEKGPYNSLSGCEAADGRNYWEAFRLLLSQESYIVTDEPSDTVGLIVSVEDTGVGIPLHAQGSVFTPFMQADSSTSRNYGGTGIGLSISKCLVELMGGEISFISRPRVGSTFTFTVGFKKCNVGVSNDLKKALPVKIQTLLQGLKAVVVDSKPVRGAVTLYHLRRLGVMADVVNDINISFGSISRQNGCSGSRLGEHLDIILVEKDSWISMEESISFWKSSFKAQDFPKMVLIANTLSPEESEKAKNAGFANTVIFKPLRASMVAVLLEQVLCFGSGKEQSKELPKSPCNPHSLLQGRYILVVDDNSVNRKVAAGALMKYGAKVECAESGAYALALLQQNRKFDACFMDIQMPEMDGFEATRQIRLMEAKDNEQIQNGTNKAKRHLPILAMTADVFQATCEECLKSGMDGYVSKPFEKEQLYKAVARFFE